MNKNRNKILLNINNKLEKFYLNKNKITKRFPGITLSEPSYDGKEAKAILRNFLKGNISQGKNVKRFESEFSKKLDVSTVLLPILVLQRIF